MDDVMVQSTTSSVLGELLTNQDGRSSMASALARGFFSGSYGVKLVRFFVFNSTFGLLEGEESNKIIYFHENAALHQEELSDSVVNEGHAKHVGLTEAIMRFASTFSTSSSKPFRTLHTLKTKSVFFEPEEDYVMVLTVAVPKCKKRKTDASGYELTYSPDDVHENVLMSTLRRSYEMFTLFTGGFRHLLELEGDKKAFVAVARSFFSHYIPTLRVEEADVANKLFGGVRFQTLEPSAFLRVHSFVSRIQDEFRLNSVFFHEGSVVWSGLQQKETSLIYQYVNGALLPSSLKRESSSSPRRSPFAGHQGRFLTGRRLLDDDEDKHRKVPKVYVSNSDPDASGLEEFYLLVYHAVLSTVCLLVPSDGGDDLSLTAELLRRLDVHMGTRLTSMSADLSDVFGTGGFLSGGVTPVLLMPAPSSEIASAALSPSQTPSSSKTSLITSSASLSSLKDHQQKTAPDVDVMLLYYNDTNKALKNTLLPDIPVSGTHSIPRYPLWTTNASNQECSESFKTLQQGLHVIADVNENFEKLNSRCYVTGTDFGSEFYVNFSSDHWVVGKKVGARQVYLLLTLKNASPTEVAEQVDKFIGAEFKNICLLEK